MHGGVEWCFVVILSEVALKGFSALLQDEHLSCAAVCFKSSAEDNLP